MSIYNNLILFSQFESVQFQQALPTLSSRDAKIAFVALAIFSTLIASFYLVKCYQERKLEKTDPVAENQNLANGADNLAQIPKSPKKVAFNEVRARQFDKNEAPNDIEKISIVMDKF